MREQRTVAARPVELRDNSDGTLTFVGYAAVYNALSEGLPFRERIMPGAFDESLASSPDVRLLFNHDPDTVMARTTAGNLFLRSDDIGLRVEAVLDAGDVDVQRVVPKLQARNVSQMSFAFWVAGPDGAEWVEVDGELERHIVRVDIDDGDVSIVTYPAYPATVAGVRALDAGFPGGLPIVRSLESLGAALGGTDGTVVVHRVYLPGVATEPDQTGDEPPEGRSGDTGDTGDTGESSVSGDTPVTMTVSKAVRLRRAAEQLRQGVR